MMSQCVALLGKFIAVREPNIRYLGLENMTRMLMVTDVQDIIKRHQPQIITSLKDPDIRLVEPCPHIVLPVLPEVPTRYNIVMFHGLPFYSQKEYKPGLATAKDSANLIGRVVSITEQKVVQVNSNPQRLIDFVIEDSRGSRLTVTLWEEHVDSVLPYYNVDLAEPLIVILQLCRVWVNKGK
nr:AP-2 complex subunit alpha-2 [Ipomoea batatas]